MRGRRVARPPAPDDGHTHEANTAQIHDAHLLLLRDRVLVKRQPLVIVQRVNRFFEWIGLKEKLHRSDHKPPFVSERDLWGASLGQNVGSEVNGKSDRFSRPVLIMRKLAHGFYLVAPTTTKLRERTWYVHVRLGNQDEYVCLNQIRMTIAACIRRSGRSIPMTSIGSGKLFGGSINNVPPLWGGGRG